MNEKEKRTNYQKTVPSSKWNGQGRALAGFPGSLKVYSSCHTNFVDCQTHITYTTPSVLIVLVFWNDETYMSDQVFGVSCLPSTFGQSRWFHLVLSRYLFSFQQNVLLITDHSHAVWKCPNLKDQELSMGNPHEEVLHKRISLLWFQFGSLSTQRSITWFLFLVKMWNHSDLQDRVQSVLNYTSVHYSILWLHQA